MPSYRAMRVLALLGWVLAQITGRAQPITPETDSGERHLPRRTWSQPLSGPAPGVTPRRTDPNSQDPER